MATEELAADEEEGEGVSVSKFGGVVISGPVGGVGPCKPLSDEADAWLLVSVLTVFGGDLEVSILCVHENFWEVAHIITVQHYTLSYIQWETCMRIFIDLELNI